MSRYSAGIPERRLNDAFISYSAPGAYRAPMRTRTLVILLVLLLVVLAVGMSAHGGHSGGMMRRLARAIHGQHGPN